LSGCHESRRDHGKASSYRSPLGITKEPGRKDDQDSIKNEEGENQPDISPPVLKPDVQRGVVLVPNRDGAIPTKRGFGWIIQVAAKVLNEIVGPCRARLTQRWVEDGEFFRIAGDLEAAEFCGEHRGGNPNPGVQLVQPYSQPILDIGVRDDDATSQEQRNRNRGIEQHSDLDRRGKCTNKLSKRNTKELCEYDREQLESSPVESNRSSSEPDRINHQNPVDDGADDRVGDLRQELRDCEHFGRVQSAVGLSNERTSVEDPERDELDLDDGRDDTHPTYREKPILQIPHALAQLQVGKGQNQ